MLDAVPAWLASGIKVLAAMHLPSLGSAAGVTAVAIVGLLASATRRRS